MRSTRIVIPILILFVMSFVAVSSVSATDVTLYPTESNDDGFIEDIDNDGDGDLVRINYNYIASGDDSGNDELKGIVHFDISSIPAGAIIDSATFRVYYYGYNTPPTALPGDAKVDHILSTTGNLTVGDFDSIALSSNIGQLVTTANRATYPEWRTLDVTTELQDDIDNSRSYSSYRSYISEGTDSDGVSDAYYFREWDYDSGSSAPELVVSYTASDTFSNPSFAGVGAVVAAAGFVIGSWLNRRRRR